MQYKATTVQEYLDQIPVDRKQSMEKLLETIRTHIPAGFSEEINYGMIGWVVPHTLFPAGYHCDPKLPLPFLNIASQKNFIALYHMGIYGIKDLMDWFVAEYPKHSKLKLDMGKSCIRFKKPDQIPFDLIGQLVQKITPERWIEVYETTMRDARKKNH